MYISIRILRFSIYSKCVKHLHPPGDIIIIFLTNNSTWISMNVRNVTALIQYFHGDLYAHAHAYLHGIEAILLHENLIAVCTTKYAEVIISPFSAD